MEPLSKIFFPKDTYKTSETNKKSWVDKIMFNSRWAFYFRYFKIVMYYRRLAINKKYHDAEWSQSGFDVFSLIERTGARFELSGLDNIHKADGPIVFIGNHMSTTETMVLPAMIAPYKNTTFVVKADLADHTFFGPIMRSKDPITLGRQEPRKDMMKLLAEGTKRLNDGISIIIFPEGTRQKEFNPKKLNSLGVKLADKANVKVIPIALKTDFWSTSTFGRINRKKKLYFAFGEPIDVSKDPKKAHQDVLKFITGKLLEWKAKVNLV